MERPLVSVITPTYRHRAFIADAVRSVLDQTYAEWEQIVVDDGSDDGTAEAAMAAADGDPRVRVIRQPHRGLAGLAATYNVALAASRGELIAILEGDDLWPPDKLARQVPGLGDPAVVLSYGVTELVDPAGRPAGHVIPSATQRRMFREALHNQPVGTATRAMLHPSGLTFTFPCSLVIRRAALERIGGFQHVEGLPVTDYPTLLRLSLLGRYAFVDAVMGRWRRHPASTTWVARRSLDRGVAELARSFASEQAVAIGLSGHDLRVLHRSWDGWVEFLDGREHLLERRWRDARRAFVVSIASGAPTFRLASLVGYVASWLQMDIEGLVRLVGRIDLRSTGVAPKR